jgi:hypothetical protein
MPFRSQDNAKKLLPLRKFSLPGAYSVAYLSQLVQKGKLKAEKIGRNFYTTKEWFDEYLDQHARDEKQNCYLDFSTEQILHKKEKKAKDSTLAKTMFSPRMILINAVFLCLIIVVNILIGHYTGDGKGKVAGESASAFNDSLLATTSEEIN